MRPIPVLPFYHFNQFPHYRAPSRSSQPSQSIRPSHVGNTCQDAQTSRPRKPIRYSYTSHTSLPRQSSLSMPPCRYSYLAQPRKSNLSRVRVTGGPTLTLANNKPMPTSRDNHDRLDRVG